MQADKTKSRDNSVNSLFERLHNLYPSYPYSYPNPNGNGELTYRKGRPIISNEYWKKLAGYSELDDVLTPDEKMQCKMALDVPKDVLSKEVWDRANAQMVKEINPKALDYFPEDIITVVFNPYYSCPKEPELYKLWTSDYRKYLTAKGYRHHEYDGSYWQDAIERYQEMKKQWDSHKSSWYRRGVNGYDGKGCNQYTGCIPECKFYPSEGKLYDGEGFD